jgi:hypothetical protein
MRVAVLSNGFGCLAIGHGDPCETGPLKAKQILKHWV